MLRLPDVIGPYDDTGRFWAYIEWIKNSKEFPIELVTKNVMNYNFEERRRIEERNEFCLQQRCNRYHFECVWSHFKFFS